MSVTLEVSEALIAAVSPKISIIENAAGFTITIQDVLGTKTIDIKNGKDGDPGEQGEKGNGIEGAKFNDDYSLTLNYTNGETYTTPSLKGKDGIGIVRIELRESVPDEYDTYAIVLDDGNETLFKVPNVTIDGYLVKIEDKKNEAITEIENLKESIPSDYTEMSGRVEKAESDVTELKDDLSQLSEEMANITGIGLSAESIDKLEEVGNYLAYTTADGGSKWTELIAILRGTSGGEEPENPEVTLTSISASYYGGDVAVGTLLNDLTGITVTAHYSNGSTANVTDYTLSGEIAEGINTITVSYGGKTTTFTVVGYVEEEPDTPPTDNTEPVYQLESPYDLASNGKTDTGFAPFATEEPYNKAFTICCTATATRVSGSITQIFDLSLNNISLLGFMYDGWYWGVPWFGGKGRPLNSEGANITGNTITDYKLIITHEANSNDIVTRYITSDNKVTTTATNFGGLKSVFEETITIGDGNTGWGSGSIDDFKWYNRVLSDEEITAYFEGV